VVGLVWAKSSGEAILPCFGKVPHDSFNPRRRLAFAEYDFGKAAPLLTLKINLSKSEVDKRRPCQAA
jgi:hypothetical protein